MNGNCHLYERVWHSCGFGGRLLYIWLRIRIQTTEMYSIHIQLRIWSQNKFRCRVEFGFVFVLFVVRWASYKYCIILRLQNGRNDGFKNWLEYIIFKNVLKSLSGTNFCCIFQCICIFLKSYRCPTEIKCAYEYKTNRILKI